MKETITKAVQDATLTVQDCARAYGTRETARKDWRAISRAKTAELLSVPRAERELYCETFEVAARHAALLVDSLSGG